MGFEAHVLIIGFPVISTYQYGIFPSNFGNVLITGNHIIHSFYINAVQSINSRPIFFMSWYHLYIYYL